jgi:hypothetical protein
VNLLHIRDGQGRVIRTEFLDGFSTVNLGLLPGGGTATIVPMPGYQLNGHLYDCRCGTCRPDLQLGDLT